MKCSQQTQPMQKDLFATFTASKKCHVPGTGASVRCFTAGVAATLAVEMAPFTTLHYTVDGISNGGLVI